MKIMSLLFILLLAGGAQAEEKIQETSKKSSGQCGFYADQLPVNEQYPQMGKVIFAPLVYANKGYTDKNCENGVCFAGAVIMYNNEVVTLFRQEVPSSNVDAVKTFRFGVQVNDSKGETVGFTATRVWSVNKENKYLVPQTNLEVLIGKEVVTVWCGNSIQPKETADSEAPAKEKQ